MRPDCVIFGRTEILPLSSSSESESPPSLDISLSDSSVLSLSSSSLARFLFVPALPLGFLVAIDLPLPVLVGVPVGVADALEALPLALPGKFDLPPLGPLLAFVGGRLGISILSDVFIWLRMLRRMFSYPGGVPVRLLIPMSLREEEVPAWMRLRIISVAAEN